MKTDNEVIAEFMGHNPSNPFLYDRYWDQLMPVVEKIESKAQDVRIWPRHCDIMPAGIETEKCNSKIEAVYKAVVEFIHFYNQNKK